MSCTLALGAVGYACVDGGLAFALAAHLLAGAVPLWKHGSEEQRRELLPKLCAGTRVAANAEAEPDYQTIAKPNARHATALVFYSGTSDIQRSIVASWLGL